MTRVSPRTNFLSSRLIRCLADLALLEPVESGDGFAEKLGLWIHFTDAIALSAVHGDSVAISAGIAVDAQPTSAAREFDRAQAALMNGIRQSCAPGRGRAHIKMPEPALGLPLDLASAYVPYRRFYEAHQRDMESSVQSLRANVREALAKASPALKKLADLDATLEKTLYGRESKLLSRVPVLLKKRFEQLFNTHQQMLAERGQADDSSAWVQAGGWLALFCDELQMLLLAEAELRLQPAMGLIEALGTHNE